jgi:UDP-N-acetylglucosamine 4,6-dehydratase
MNKLCYVNAMLDNKTILVTGATGSFGQAFVKIILKKYPKIKKIIIFSRDELKQFEMQQRLDPKIHKNLRYFLGDIRDKDRLMLAFRGVNIVIHAAALKQVPAGEYNPFEFIKTNIFGAQNILESALFNGVEKIISISTDKASSPINLYGATKFCSDKLFIAGQNMFGKNNGLKITVVRYGNVFASRGSVIPFFLKQIKTEKYLTVTDKQMTRFNISLSDGIDTVLWAIKNSIGGEIIVPKLHSLKIMDIAEIIAQKKVKIIGRRPGEKVHEELISINEAPNTIELEKYYAILPEISYDSILKYYEKKFKFKRFPENDSYNSFDNKKYLTKIQIKYLIEEYKNSN